MLAADNKYGGGEFAEVEGKLLYGEEVSVPDVCGMTVAEAESLLRSLGFNLYESRTG